MKKTLTALFTIMGILASIPQVSSAQSPHPKKQVFKDVQSWPATSPGDISLKDFGAFRAVYQRTYKQHSGPQAGALRQDRVLITAEEVAWDGVAAAAITLVDSGIVEHDDTNARVLNMIVSLEDLGVRLEIGPIPGAAKDYYLGLFTDDAAYFNRVKTQEQTHEGQKMATTAPGFGPGVWVMASMELKAGLKIRLDPYYSPQANPLSAASYGQIIGQKPYADSSGTEYTAWVLETSRNLTSPKVSHIYLVDRPPYYLGTDTVDLETGDRKPFVRLDNYVMLP